MLDTCGIFINGIDRSIKEELRRTIRPIKLSNLIKVKLVKLLEKVTSASFTPKSFYYRSYTRRPPCSGSESSKPHRMPTSKFFICFPRFPQISSDKTRNNINSYHNPYPNYNIRLLNLIITTSRRNSNNHGSKERPHPP